LADTQVHEAGSGEALREALCGADRTVPHIFVLPASVFEEGGEIDCEHGMAALRSAEPENDSGHWVLNIDPPEGVDDGLDCDGKADIGMDRVAINCLPANHEAKGHRKN
jgi:hypothetical protein